MKLYPHLMVSETEKFNQDYPIVKVKLYKGGMEVIRNSTIKIDKPIGVKRGKVKELSKQSLTRLAFLVATSRIIFTSIITLTYGLVHPTSGKQVKMHLRNFLQETKREFGSYSYVWFLEFQKRGAPHIHILLTLPPPTQEQRERMASIWVHCQEDIILKPKMHHPRISRVRELKKVLNVHSHKKSWEAIRKPNGAKFYVVKYATKIKQKEVPKSFQDVGRFWGNSRDVKNQDFQEVDVTEAELREYLSSQGLSVAKSPILPKRIIDLK